MAPSREYAQFLTFLELIESMSAGHRTESVTLRDDAGRIVGLLTLDGGKVRFGVHFSGQLYLDEIVLNEAPRHAAALQKILNRVSLTRGEKDLLTEVSLQHHAALCGLTARALRRIAALYAPTRQGRRPPELGLPQLRLLNISFTPVELALAAGRRNSPRSDDVAVRVYGNAPEHADERWLFEWQSEDPSSPWPVQTAPLHERKVADVASFSALGQLLARLFSARRLLGDRASKRAQLVRMSESLFYLVSSARYLTVLQYHQAHFGRLLCAMEDFVSEASVRALDPGPAPRSRPAALAPAPVNSSGPRLSALPPPLPAPTRSIKQADPRPRVEPAAVLAKRKAAEPAARVNPLVLAPPILPAPASAPEPPSELLQLDEAAWVEAASQLVEDSAWMDATSLLVAEQSIPPTVEPEPHTSSPEPEALPTIANQEPRGLTPEPEAPAPSPEPEVIPPSVKPEEPAQTPEPQAPAPTPDPEAPAPSPEPDVRPLSTSQESPAPIPVAARTDSPTEPEPSVPDPTPSEQRPLYGSEALISRTALAMEARPDEKHSDVHSAPRPPRFTPPLLSLCRLTARVEGRTVLKDVELEVGSRGVYALMGPGGSGKSSLSGILSGRNRVASGWELSGELRYEGAPLGSSTRPVLIGQKLSRSMMPLREYLLADLDDGIAGSVPDASLTELLERVRLMRLTGSLSTPLGSPGIAPSQSEWWRLAIARELIMAPRMLCVDEPTAGMDEEAASPILDLLREEGARRAILFVTHNQQHARRCSDYVILLAGGRLQEYLPTAEFFSNPTSRAARDYVRTGGCSVPSPDAPVEHMEESITPSVHGAEREATPPAASPARVASPPPALTPSDSSHRGDSEAPAPSPHSQQAAPADPPAGTPSVPLWMCPSPALSLRGFGLRLGGRPVFADLSFDIAPRGAFLIVAENSGERKLLVRALCGPRPETFQMTGSLRYCGQDLLEVDGPVTPQASAQLLVMRAIDYVATNLRTRSRLTLAEQRVQAREIVARAGLPELRERLNVEMTELETLERRVLEVVRAIAAEPPMMILEDPASGLPPSQRDRLLAVIRQQAQLRAVLILAQDPTSYAELEATVAWLTDGRMTARPLQRVPSSLEAHAPALLADAERAAEPAHPSAVPAAAIAAQPAPARGRGPRGFQWLREGALAGMPAPGLTNDLGYELDLVRSAGVTCLVTLTTDPLDGDALRERGLQSIFFPIEDMRAPSETEAALLAARVADLLAQGRAVAFHCKAGLGRTGTILAAQLIWEGMDAKGALGKVRSVEPGWVQSDEQIRFLSRYEQWLRGAQTPKESKQGHPADTEPQRTKP